MKVPRDVGPGATRVFLAVMADDRPTISTIMARTGFSRGGVHYHLTVLRDIGLVDWQNGNRGTLRALYGPVNLP